MINFWNSTTEIQNNSYRFPTPHFRQLGYFIWLILLFFSFLFYQERTLWLDAGFQIFEMINDGVPKIYHYRFITALPQIPSFIALGLGASLKLILILYSLSYILFYATIYHLLVKWLKNDWLGWVLIALFTLLTLDAFYHIQSEYYLGLSLLLVVFGIVLRFPKLEGWRLWVGVSIVLITIAFSHKLTIIFFLFLWVFFWGKEEQLRHRRYVLLLGLMLVSAAFKSAFYTNWYEVLKQEDFRRYLEQYFPNYWEIPANFIFLERCINHYYWFPILLLLVTFFYLVKKQWWKLAWMWVFSIGYILLYNISDPEAPYRFYSEVTYLPLMIFVSVPLMFDLIPYFLMYFPKRYRLLFTAFVLIFTTRLFIIAANHRPYQVRLKWVEQQLNKTTELQTNRLFLSQENVPMDTVVMDWGIPYTSLIMSSLESETNSKTLLIHENITGYKYYDFLEKENYFLTRFKAIEVEHLNAKYFSLGQRKYQILE